MRNSCGVLIAVLLLITAIAQTVSAQIEIGNAPTPITLQDKAGGRLDGTLWSSNELKNKISVVFYVDPDEKDLNNDASEALKKENFPEDKVQSYAIINMAATWLPNFAISKSLKEKQEQYKTTIYVRDYKKTLVKKWGLSDNTSDVMAFDADGKLLFRKDGKMNPDEIKQLVDLIKEKLPKE